MEVCRLISGLVSSSLPKKWYLYTNSELLKATSLAVIFSYEHNLNVYILLERFRELRIVWYCNGIIYA